MARPAYMERPASPPRLSDAEWQALLRAVAYARSYWEEGHADERRDARTATRALDKIATHMRPRRRPS